MRKSVRKLPDTGNCLRSSFYVMKLVARAAKSREREFYLNIIVESIPIYYKIKSKFSAWYNQILFTAVLVGSFPYSYFDKIRIFCIKALDLIIVELPVPNIILHLTTISLLPFHYFRNSVNLTIILKFSDARRHRMNFRLKKHRRFNWDRTLDIFITMTFSAFHFFHLRILKY